MWRYFILRLALAVPTLLALACLVFILVRVIPGDIVELRMVGGGMYVSEEMIAAERVRLGLHKPLVQQFADYVLALMRLDLGISMWTGNPVSHEIALRLPLSLQLAGMASAVALAMALPLGTLAAVRHHTWVDYAVQLFSAAGLAIPSFWLGILMVLGLVMVFQWIPPLTFVPFWIDPVHNLSQLIWPALAIGYRYAAVATRITRSSVLHVVQEDYLRTARAKGLRERRVLLRHGLRNALLPVLTVVGIEFAFLLGGLVVTEQVFNLNGIGKLFVEAVSHRDYTLMQGIMLLIAFTYVVINLIIDSVYAWLDPRVVYH